VNGETLSKCGGAADYGSHRGLIDISDRTLILRCITLCLLKVKALLVSASSFLFSNIKLLIKRYYTDQLPVFSQSSLFSLFSMSSHKSKKRKLNQDSSTDLDTSKPTAVFQPTSGRSHTLSIALPGSIISNAQSHDLKSILGGQIARALAVFCVDEVIVFDDTGDYGPDYHFNDSYYTGHTNPNHFMTHLLTYLETPPHLRKHLFPIHDNLRTAGTLPSLDMPHHLRAHEWCQYREGVVIEGKGAVVQANRSAQNGKMGKKGKHGKEEAPESSCVEVGFDFPVDVGISIPPHTRVTVKFASQEAPTNFQHEAHQAEAVAPSSPREVEGYYWGYQVRAASSLSAIFTESPFDGGYDLTFGSSERGRDLSELVGGGGKEQIPGFRHMLIVFGGVAGLEAAAKMDKELLSMRVGKVEELFDYWVNLCPGQGSRTIRTEEAVWMALTSLRGIVNSRGMND